MQLRPKVQVDVAQEMVDFHWDDDTHLRISHQQLRDICPCAFCKSKRLLQQTGDNNIGLSGAGLANTNQPMVHITDMFDQGYGAQICFSDGHDKGIFPWIFLKNINNFD